MPNANSIEYAKLFQTTLDEQLLQELTTGWMEANASQVKYNGGNEVKIPKVSMGGLGTYSRTNGYADNAGVTMTFETHTFSMDRSTKIRLDRMDVDESGFVATASTVASEFQRTKVAPEVDAYRYSKIFTLANAAFKTGAYTPVAATIFSKLKSDITTVQDTIGETNNLVIAMSFEAANILDQASQISHELSFIDFTVGGISSKVRSIDGIPIIRVSSDRFKSEYTFSATNGYTATATAMLINWIIIPRNSVIAVVKTDMPKIINPEVNQDADAWDVSLRKYHDLWIPDNKLNSVYLSYKETAAPALTATVAQGSASGTTKFTATAGTGNSLGYTLTATADPGYYNTIPTITEPYTSGADITATAGQYLNMYVIDTTTKRVEKFLSYKLVSGDIKA